MPRPSWLNQKIQYQILNNLLWSHPPVDAGSGADRGGDIEGDPWQLQNGGVETSAAGPSINLGVLRPTHSEPTIPNADQRSTGFGRLVVDGRRAALPDASLNRWRGIVEKDEASATLGMGLKIGLDKNLDGLVAGVNFDADWRIAEIDFVPTTIVSPAEPRAALWSCRRSRQRASPDCARMIA